MLYFFPGLAQPILAQGIVGPGTILRAFAGGELDKWTDRHACALRVSMYDACIEYYDVCQVSVCVCVCVFDLIMVFIHRIDK